ncbi:MAG TPA: CAP domain-containing protein [Ramlibacter sp.]|uniref:CAP domain-containing protein n=1 Tax=Ramlibacter sp. TaxID=1917967 RepID=UPI002D1B9956|nr:CAP domain-containing protein [Ramlibacter sp.]HVZ43985.1 CAP domain-containing protein [Ramlibacter sp.]
MRPTNTAKTLARSSAVIAAAVLVHSFAAAATFKASPCSVPGMREAIVQQVNAVRARGGNCGGDAFGPAQPVAWNQQLVSAASGHSADMAENNYFDHVSRAGSHPADRVEAAGYHWRSVAENIAAGQFDTNGVMKAWMESPGHCSNIMDPKYSEIGVACVQNPGSYYGGYWTMVLGRRMGRV